MYILVWDRENKQCQKHNGNAIVSITDSENHSNVQYLCSKCVEEMEDDLLKQAIDQKIAKAKNYIIKQQEDCYAIAFNKSGTLMVAGCNESIKVWQFEEGQMTELKTLNGHAYAIYCLVFSKKINWFVSGSMDNTIRGWKEEGNNWIRTQSQQQHNNSIICLVLNDEENELISCSSDKTIKVWNVDCSSNKIQFSYSLQNKHKNGVNALSLNANETALVSCSLDETIILWMKGQNQKWEYINHVKATNSYRMCFINDTQFMFCSEQLCKTTFFSIEDKKLEEQDSPQMYHTQDECVDTILFPTIFNKQRQAIIQKHNKYVYIINFNNWGWYVYDTIDCQTGSNYGALTENGEYLVIWNAETKEFKIKEIGYQYW